MAEALQVNDAPSWSKWVTDFDSNYGLFNSNYQALLSLRSYIYGQHPELTAQYDRLVSDGTANKNRLDQLKSVRDSVVGWLNELGQIIGAPITAVENAAGGAWDWIRRQIGLSGLAIAPVIVAVGLASAIAALVVIAAWIKDAYSFAQRTNALMAQEARGASPAQAAAIVQGLLPAGDNILGIPWKWLIFGAIAVALGPQLLKMISRKA